MIDIYAASAMWKAQKPIPFIAEHFGVSPRSLKRVRDAYPNLFPERPPSKPHRSRNLKVFERLEEEIKEIIEMEVKRSRKSFKRAEGMSITSTPIAEGKRESMEYDQSRLPYARILDDLDVANCCKYSLTENPKGIPNLFCAEVAVTGKNYCAHHQSRVVKSIASALEML